ncbi:hypothetical protein [Chlorobium phaeovibrioides]|uniref:hypothetical protein n=1 Tax=Chlorobium phaeovibrioides TaxID=1094 RepID=UPI001CB8EB30|nr:hypothetical protein [Chlorobium phaeovibrioides]
MIKILCLHIAENQASYRYRVAQFLPYWKEYGIEMHPVSITGKNYIDKLSLRWEVEPTIMSGSSENHSRHSSQQSYPTSLS